MILGLIPARFGSKRLPYKNTQKINGEPLITLAIKAALNSRVLDRCVLSTDSKKMAEIGKKAGAQIPFIRPRSLAKDESSTLSVMQHAIIQCEKIYAKKVKTLVLLEPTAPLRTSADIRKALSLFNRNKSDAVISAVPSHSNPYFGQVKKRNRYFELVIPSKKKISRSQDAPKTFDLSPVVWIFSRKAIMKEKKRIPKKTLLYKIPLERSLDIDNAFDLRVARALLRKKHV